ncbi:unnamed protein product [Euphydryas editha]|uniref:Helitron helicase-like domain-containing protein n=1 Tax=Euphydryas editha TaxID=104508 RepID=A0AAU9UQ76_EUPED|nr:unnamed protein product [Euphydryas editha]
MYAKIETERLVYIRSNQRQLRAEEYVDLRDAMQQDNDMVNMGRLVILPSSFTGGPRYMHERTQDAFCYITFLEKCCVICIVLSGGLPHAHILLWLKDKVRPNDIDSSIRAEIPDPIADPVLYDIVKTHMIHGPCGAFNGNAPCIQDGRCTKRYPKSLSG